MGVNSPLLIALNKRLMLGKMNISGGCSKAIKGLLMQYLHSLIVAEPTGGVPEVWEVVIADFLLLIILYIKVTK